MVNEEINKWKNRVFYPDEVFKTDTKANLDNLNCFLKKSKEHFVTICCSSEISIYKIGRYMIENGITNDNITFQDGAMIGPYIDINTILAYKSRDLLNELCTILRPRVFKKWLIIPYLDNIWNKQLALMFINQLEQMGCYGLLFYSPADVSGNLAQILCEDSFSDQILQFPKVRYLNDHKEKPLEDDGF